MTNVKWMVRTYPIVKELAWFPAEASKYAMICFCEAIIEINPGMEIQLCVYNNGRLEIENRWEAGTTVDEWSQIQYSKGDE